MIFISACMLLSFASCEKSPEPVNNIPDTDITAFTAWLDSEGFVPGLSQGEMIQKMESYTQNGESVANAAGLFYDGYNGGGYAAGGDNFGFRNDYQASDDNKTADYTNSFYTKVPLDGLTLPVGIEFEDTLRDVLDMLSIATDPSANFTADEGSDIVMTLYRDDRYTLIFKNWYLSKEPIEVDIPYELIFIENYTYVHIRADNRESSVTRTIEFTFAPETKTIDTFRVAVHENYKLRKATGKEHKIMIAEGDESWFVGELRIWATAGDNVEAVITTVTETNLYLWVNGERYTPVKSDLEYTYFEFVMPNKEVTLSVEAVSVDIPVG